MKKYALLLVIIVTTVSLVVPGVMAQPSPGANILLWEFIQGEQDGQLERLTSTGERETLVQFSPGVFDNQARPCGQDYWTVGGEGAVLFTGAANGTIAIYPLSSGESLEIGSAHRMACSGPATFQFAPNGQRLGYINYVHNVLERVFPAGDLVIVETATGNQLAGFDWTTAFALHDDGVLLLRFFPDGKGNAVEADIDWWDGTARRTLGTLEPVYPADIPDLECSLTSGAIVEVKNQAYILSGQSCENGSRSWRLVSVPMQGGQITEIASGEPAGGYFPESFSTQLLPVQDGSGFLMMIPSGLARNTSSLFWVTLTGEVTPILGNQHILVDRYGDRLSEARHTMLSPDGGALAFVTVTGDGIQTLYMLDLSSVGNDPIKLEEEGSGQRIFHYLWSSSERLYYAAGSIESSSLHVASRDGVAQRLARGRFFRIAVNYAGDKVAAAEWYANPERLGDDLFKLTLLDVQGTATDVVMGGQEHNQLIPLAVQ